jgi:hypothetical protein
MKVFKCTDYPILFQPYTLRISIENEKEQALLAAIFMNPEVVAKALTYLGHDHYDELVNLILTIGKEMEI